MGSRERVIARQAIQAGREMPERILNSPVLEPGLDFFLEAYFDLDCERSHAMGPTAIPWSSMKSYAEFYELDFEETHEFIFLLKQMDRANLEKISKEQSKQNG